MLLKLVPDNTTIPFLNGKKIAAIFSTLMIIASLGIFFSKGLNLGIDFKGGITLEIGTQTEADVALFRSTIEPLGLGEVAIQEFGDSGREVLIKIESQPADEEAGINAAQAQQIAIEKVQGALAEVMDGLSYRRVNFVGPKVSGELIVDGLNSVLFAIGAVLLYIWVRFEWQFGLGAVIALVHDVILTVGFFSITQLEFNLSIIAAILTIVGYSLNDTVVVYDRVRENLRKFTQMELGDLLNMSLNSTLNRTVMTSLTTLLALIALYFLGGPVIQGFTAAMIWGVFVGTYSSVFIAVPALEFMNLERTVFEEVEDEMP